MGWMENLEKAGKIAKKAGKITANYMMDGVETSGRRIIDREKQIYRDMKNNGASQSELREYEEKMAYDKQSYEKIKEKNRRRHEQA